MTSVIGVFVLVAVITGLSVMAARDDTNAGAGSSPADPPRPDDAFAMTVTKIIDGDTIHASLTTPNDVVTTTRPISIRLIGINTPETYPELECWGDEARSALGRMIPEGSTVWVGTDAETWDRYDRRLFYLWTDEGRFVNLELVREGSADTLRIAPNVAHAPLFAEARDDADDADLGRWGACG
mgnify:CR=1 FL=1